MAERAVVFTVSRAMLDTKLLWWVVGGPRQVSGGLESVATLRYWGVGADGGVANEALKYKLTLAAWRSMSWPHPLQICLFSTLRGTKYFQSQFSKRQHKSYVDIFLFCCC